MNTHLSPVCRAFASLWIFIWGLVTVAGFIDLANLGFAGWRDVPILVEAGLLWLLILVIPLSLLVAIDTYAHQQKGE